MHPAKDLHRLASPAAFVVNSHGGVTAEGVVKDFFEP